MPDNSFAFEIPTEGAVVIGRNGTFFVTAIGICAVGNMAAIEAVGKSGRTLNAGFYTVPVETMDKLCKNWLESRGLLNE